jgi:predicted metal-dependent hydrolase
MRSGNRTAMDSKWTQLMAWHLAEEIEHRTVTFDAYEKIVGKYPYRLAVGTRAQVHFLGYMPAMAHVVYQDQVNSGITRRRVKIQAAKRAWRTGSLQGTLRAMSPRYNPRNVEICDDVREVTDSFGIDLG